MKQSNIPTSFFMSLMEFLVGAKHQVVTTSAEFGLTSVQAMTLLLTEDSKPRSMGNLCRIFGCDASNMTGIVDGLEQKHLVTRQAHPHDRRIKIICLSDAGRRLKQQILKATAQNSNYLFDPLSDTETTQLMAIIEKLAASSAAAKCVK